MKRTFATLLCSMSIALPAVVSAATVVVSSCPTTVGMGDTGVLQGDLDCSVAELSGNIVLERGAKLDLGGHTLTVNANGVIVRCKSTCEIRNGALVGTVNGYAAVNVATGGRITVRNVDISGMNVAINALDGSVKAIDSSLAGTQWGIASAKKVSLKNVSAQTSTPGGYCIGATNEEGSMVSGTTVNLISCADGVWASKSVKMKGLTAVGLGGIAVYSGQYVMLRDSTVTGATAFDIVSGRRPRLANSTCTRSGVDINDIPVDDWDVCTND